ncbi:MAG TPA: chemotaxis response regulator protein-glutamate methylesterase [Candidatus Sulfotelmatobacter sp.]|nr:chemotaxis response regulator protein-glutamate methylesterase [Candidatus Sulfotelmatobacter sp.]
MTGDATTRAPIRVLVVDDSAFMRAALSRMIASESGLEVAATACSGSDALDKIPSVDPDVVTLDIEMPGLDGVQTLRRIMKQFPRPVIMVSGAAERSAENTFDALAAGAFDYVPKDLSPTSLDILHIRSDLVAKIRAAAQSRKAPAFGVLAKKPPQPLWSASPAGAVSSRAAIVALGISTGGPKALQDMLPLFPRDLSVPILIVQHMPLGFTAPFAKRLNSLCSVAVREATHGENLCPGVVYLAPAGRHMRVERQSARAILSLDTQPEDCQHIPSVDVLMNSVAAVFHNLALGVIMTGMGSDGAEGMQSIFREGGLTIGQDEATCTVYGMPRVCAELGILNRVVPLSQIPAQIIEATRSRKLA